jgi:hypothetical protein
VNVGVDKLAPGVFGVSHGSGMAGELIRHATGSWAGHAFLYLGKGAAPLKIGPFGQGGGMPPVGGVR